MAVLEFYEFVGSGVNLKLFSTFCPQSLSTSRIYMLVLRQAVDRLNRGELDPRDLIETSEVLCLARIDKQKRSGLFYLNDRAVILQAQVRAKVCL